MKNLRNLWPFLKYSFWLYVVIELAAAASNAHAVTFWRKIHLEQEVSVEAANFIDLHQSVAGGLLLLLYVISIVAFSRFFYRAMKNLYTVNADYVEISPFWTIGYYFIPFLNLWKPFGAICQIWRGSHSPKGGDYPSLAIVGWWWAFWLIGNFLSNISLRMSVRAGLFGEEITNIPLFISTLYIDIVAAVLSVLSALFVLAIAKRIMRAQEEMIVSVDPK